MVFVALKRLEPAVFSIQTQMGELELQLSADLQGILQFLVVAGIVNFNFQVFRPRIRLGE